MKALLDEQISGRVAAPLRERGHDVLAITEEPSLRGLDDSDVFELAQAQERTVVTYNRADFEVLVREWVAADRAHHGLVLVHPGKFPGNEFGRLATALSRFLDAPPAGRSFLVWLQG